MLKTFVTTRVLFVAPMALAVGLTAQSASAQDAKIKQGEAVYTAQKCSICHSIAGKGSKVSPLDGVGKKLTAAEIRDWIVKPKEMTDKTKSTKKPPMPDKYSKLPAAEIDAMVAYLSSLK